MKIIIVQDVFSPQRFTENHLQKIRDEVSGVEVRLVDDKKDAISAALPDAEVLIYGKPPEEIDLSHAKILKWVQLASAGANDWADFLKNKDIVLTNASGVHPIPIAEHIFTFMLMFSRQINKAFRTQVRDRTWKRDIAPGELAGKTMGIVGYGNIGRRAAKLAKAFDMRVIALSHHDNQTDNSVDTFYPKENTEIFLKEADFIVNCLPLTHETEHYFDKSKFAQMKSTAYFINIGRGGTVLESDLIRALDDKTIAGAGLDVFEEEPLPDASRLWTLENVIITPHFAGWTPEYMNRLTDIFIKNLKAFLANEKMPTLVDKNAGY